MGGKFKNIPLDFVSLGLTSVALIFHIIGLFAGPWWVHDGPVGKSEFGMLTFRMCQIFCVDYKVLALEGGREWVLTVRIFEVFGLIFLLLAVLMAVLAVILRRRLIHTAVIYLNGAAALFILVGVFIFLGFNSKLNTGLEGKDSIYYPFGMCILGGVVCIATSIVSGYGLKWHLLHWDDDDDDDEVPTYHVEEAK